jgi:hypothetical protein
LVDAESKIGSALSNASQFDIGSPFKQSGFADMMNSSALNDHGCFLLANGSISQSLEFLKQALSTLKQEVQDGRQVGCSARRPQHKTLSLPSSSSLSCVRRHQERFQIYSRPLLMGESVVRSSVSDAFTITFNVALAAHLQGIESSLDGDMDAAHRFFTTALKMYYLTLRQNNDGNDCAPLNSRNDLIFAAIFNNLAHVHAALGENDYSLAAAEQLLKALFFLVDSGRIVSSEEMQAHSFLMKNASMLVMPTSSTAAAA